MCRIQTKQVQRVPQDLKRFHRCANRLRRWLGRARLFWGGAERERFEPDGMNPEESAISTKGGAESTVLATNHPLSGIFEGWNDTTEAVKASILAATNAARQ